MELVGVIAGIIAAVFVVIFGGRGLIDLARGYAERRRAPLAPADDAFARPAGPPSAETAAIPVAAEAELALEEPISPETLAQGMFIGRDEEMSELKGLLEEALGGHGRLLMLAGEPGIGKTRTALELASHAVERGALALVGRCYESQGTPPYWPWVQAIRSYVRGHDAADLRADMGTGATDIAEVVPEVRQRLPDLPPPPALEPEQARFRLFDAVTTFLQRAAHRRPLVLLLDDLHWADRPSLLLLEFLAREISGTPLLVLGTYRDVEVSRRHPLHQTLAELTREHLFQRVLLRGLDREDVQRFIDATAGMTLSREVGEAVYAQSEGNPLFLTEIVRLLQEEGVLTQAGGSETVSREVRIPEGVREVIGRRLDRLSERCNETLTIASVIGREFSLEQLDRLQDDLSGDELLEVVEEALGARVIEELPRAVGQYQFAHALVQETLVDELSTTRRARLHARIAGVLEALYAANPAPHLSQLAHHYAEAAQAGDPDKAVDYCAQAAEAAMAQLAYEEAARHYEMALQAQELREPVDKHERCQLLLGVGQAQLKAGEFPRAMVTFQQAADAARARGSSEDLANAAIGLAEAHWRPGFPGEPAVPLLEEALAAIPEGDSPLRALALASQARTLAVTASNERATRVAHEATEMARRLGDLATLATTLRTAGSLFNWGWSPLGSDRSSGTTMVAEMIALAQKLGDVDALREGYLYQVYYLMESGDLHGVDEYRGALAGVSEKDPAPHYHYLLASWQVIRALLDGRFAEVEALAQEALAIGRRLHTEAVDGTLSMQMFALFREQGRLRELEAAVKMFVERSSGASIWRPGLAIVFSELGRPEEARSELDRLAADDFAGVPEDTMWTISMAFLAEVCAYLGDGARTETLYRLLLPSDGLNVMAGHALCYGPASRLLGILATTVRRWDDAQRHFEDALSMNAKMGARPWLARTQLDYAGMLLARAQAGDRDRAMPMVDEALATAQELGMGGLTERAQALRDRAGSRRG